MVASSSGLGPTIGGPKAAPTLAEKRDSRVRKEAAHIRKVGANSLGRNGVFVDPVCLQEAAPTDQWIVFVQGPATSSLWRNSVFELVLTFPERYPFRAPQIKFKHPIFHPNVSPDDGSLCLRILQDQWSPTYRTDMLLQIVRTLLSDPNFSATDEGAGVEDLDSVVVADQQQRGTGVLPKKLYHYTNEEAKKLIESNGVLKASVGGARGPGVYSTCLHPTNLTKEQIMGNTACKGADWVIELDVEVLQTEGFDVNHCNHGFDRSLRNADHYLITKGATLTRDSNGMVYNAGPAAPSPHAQYNNSALGAVQQYWNPALGAPGGAPAAGGYGGVGGVPPGNPGFFQNYGAPPSSRWATNGWVTSNNGGWANRGAARGMWANGAAASGGWANGGAASGGWANGGTAASGGWGMGRGGGTLNGWGANAGAAMNRANLMSQYFVPNAGILPGGTNMISPMDIRLNSNNSVISTFEVAGSCTPNLRAAELFRADAAAYRAGVEHSILLFGQHLPGVPRQTAVVVADAAFDGVVANKSAFFAKAGARWSGAVGAAVRIIKVVVDEHQGGQQERKAPVPPVQEGESGSFGLNLQGGSSSGTGGALRHGAAASSSTGASAWNNSIEAPSAGSKRPRSPEHKDTRPASKAARTDPEEKAKQVAAILCISMEDAKLLMTFNDNDVERSVQAHLEDPNLIASLRLAASMGFSELD